MRKLHSFYITCLSLGLLVPAHAGATSIVAADDGGYAGNVIEKVGNEWTPPPGLRGTFSVRIKVTVGEDGKVRSCKPTEASAIKALDDAACGAVYKAAPFGKTPDGKPVDVHMAFRIGTPKKAPREPSFEEAAIETMKERERLNNQMANEKASYQSSRAKEQAEALAQKVGRELPDLRMPPLEVSKPVPVPSPLGRNRRDAAGTADRNARAEQGRQTQSRQKIESSGVPVTAPKTENTPKTENAPELVIKSNLKNLDEALEAQSEATAEAQAPSPNSPITFVNRQPAQSGAGTAAVPPRVRSGASSLTQDELDVPPLEHLKAEVVLLPAPSEPETPPAPAPAQQGREQVKDAGPGKAPVAVQAPQESREGKDAKGAQDAKAAKDAKEAKEPRQTGETVKSQKAEAAQEAAKEPAKGKDATQTKPDAKDMQKATPKAPETAKQAGKEGAQVKAPEQASAPATTPATSTAVKAAPDTADKAQESRKAQTAVPAQAAGNKETPPPADMGYAEYLDRLKQDVQKKIKLPAKLPQGRHIVSVQLYLSRKGRIQRADLIHNSSNVKRDEQLAEAVRLVDRVTPPPAALGRSFPLTLVFDVQ